MSIETVAIVGFGRFGQFLADILLEHTTLKIMIVSRRSLDLPDPRLTQIELSELTKAQIVIPTVAISAFETVIKNIAPYLGKQTTIIDMCSVKEHPVACMQKYLSTEVEIIACHPMFGPDSVKKNKGLVGLPIMLWSQRYSAERFTNIKSFCQQLELQIVEITPTQHDQYAAHSQAYAFLIGKLGQEMKLTASSLDTWWYSVLREQAEAVANDDPQLFWDIQTYNRFAGEMRQKFAAVSNQLLQVIDQKISLPKE